MGLIKEEIAEKRKGLPARKDGRGLLRGNFHTVNEKTI